MIILISIKDFSGLNHMFVSENQNCKSYWWSMLLHIQTYVNPDHMVRILNFKLDLKLHIMNFFSVSDHCGMCL